MGYCSGDQPSGGEIFLADIPLLYETEGETICDRVVVVACSEQIQQERLVSRSALSVADARSIIASQMPLSEKISRADHLAWNNGPQSVLESQAATFANFLTTQMDEGPSNTCHRTAAGTRAAVAIMEAPNESPAQASHRCASRKCRRCRRQRFRSGLPR